MKKILFLLLLPFSSFAQTPFISTGGVILREATQVSYTNNVTTDQPLISSTIRANSMTVNRPYAFTCDLSLSTTVVTLPTISFNVKLGSNSLVFVNNAVPSINLSAAAMTINGYIILRPNGNVLVKYSVTPTGSVAPIGLTSSNNVQFANWTNVNTAIDNAFSVNVSFSNTLTTTTIKREYYARSEF